MNVDICSHIWSCEHCTRFKQPQEREELHKIKTSYPLELVHMDFVTIGKMGETKVLNILVITDHFTKYVQAYVTLKQTDQVIATTMAKTLRQSKLIDM